MSEGVQSKFAMHVKLNTLSQKGIKYQVARQKLQILQSLKIADIPSLDLETVTQIRWSACLPKLLFYGEINKGRRSQGGQKNTLKTP